MPAHFRKKAQIEYAINQLMAPDLEKSSLQHSSHGIELFQKTVKCLLGTSMVLIVWWSIIDRIKRFNPIR